MTDAYKIAVGNRGTKPVWTNVITIGMASTIDSTARALGEPKEGDWALVLKQDQYHPQNPKAVAIGA